MNGVFITFEGGEAVGKSTQLQLVKTALLAQGRLCIATREPGGTDLGEKIRQLFLSPPGGGLEADPQAEPLDIETELLLLLAARRHHWNRVIGPALRQGFWVLCDRYIDSTLVYQGIMRGHDLSKILYWHEEAGMGFLPHVTFLLRRNAQADLDHRCQVLHMQNRFDQRPPSFHHQVEHAYIHLAHMWPQRFYLPPRDATPQEISQDIVGEIHRRFPS